MPISAERVHEYLENLDYPATKWQVVECAERNGAPDEVIEAVRALPLGDYDSRDQITRSIDTPGSDGVAR